MVQRIRVKQNNKNKGKKNKILIDGQECGSYPDKFNGGGWVEVKCSKPVRGANVRIETTTNTNMSLSEIEVYGIIIGEPKGPSLPPGKPFYVKSRLPGGRVAYCDSKDGSRLKIASWKAGDRRQQFKYDEKTQTIRNVQSNLAIIDQDGNWNIVCAKGQSFKKLQFSYDGKHITVVKNGKVFDVEGGGSAADKDGTNIIAYGKHGALN